MKLEPFRFRLSLCLAFLVVIVGAQAQSDKARQESLDAQRQEDAQEYFNKWLKEDVVYIISPEEKGLFENLTTADEKEQFIEQFWRRRDPDLTTSINEFKEEHYRRISWANERFTSAIPGWKTDRGRVYIIHGAPQELEAHPTGGAYTRPLHEGGGTTGAYPFEIWRYRRLEGVGTDIELLFVDPTFSEEYRLAMRPEEKDAFLNVGGGDTRAEEMGLVDKSQRPYFRPGNMAAYRDYPMQFLRAQDMPFQRYETYTFVQRPPQIKYPDLKELINVNVTYSTLPFSVRADYFRLNDRQVLVPISLEFQNRDLTFQNATGTYVAKIGIYGILSDMSNRVVMEFEDDVIASYAPENLDQGRLLRSMYQKTLPLDLRQRYKLDVVVKDINGNKVGVSRYAVIPPRFEEEGISVSSLILSDQVRWLKEIPTEDQMFVLGDIWIIPILDKTFSGTKPLGVYLQVYGTSFDQATLEPELKVTYRILKDNDPVVEIVDQAGETVIYFSNRRVVLVRGMPVEDLIPGEYRLEVVIEDELSGQRVTAADTFKIKNETEMASSR
jgi:GWxTD domain-containing protein